MNPSASGWINKLLNELSQDNSLFMYSNAKYYNALRESGFIYGSNINNVGAIFAKSDLSAEEISKINLLLSLLYIQNQIAPKIDSVLSIIDFYIDINAHKTSIFQDILGEKKSNTLLEKIINKRVQINDNILVKNFNYFVINALLFVDVLAYKEYLKKGHVSSIYIKNLEAAIEAIALDVLNAKAIKTEYDMSLIKLFESSRRYQNISHISYNQAIKLLHSDLEKYYILDIACMATWGDRTIDKTEQAFLHQLGLNLNLDRHIVEQSILTVNRFYTDNKDNIALLSSKNIVKSFYDNSSKMVSKLISRNGKRLKKELQQSKELMLLLSHSTVRDLSKEEQKRAQEQLLDVFKTIPSLAIFMLPGGALLLPLFVKFIPKLLPSAFDDNRIEE